MGKISAKLRNAIQSEKLYKTQVSKQRSEKLKQSAEEKNGLVALIPANLKA